MRSKCLPPKPTLLVFSKKICLKASSMLSRTCSVAGLNKKSKQRKTATELSKTCKKLSERSVIARCSMTHSMRTISPSSDTTMTTLTRQLSSWTVCLKMSNTKPILGVLRTTLLEDSLIYPVLASKSEAPSSISSLRNSPCPRF